VVSLFVVPCKYDPARPLVQDCVARIRRHHPDADILVVDSASDDRSYFDDLADFGVTIADIGNLHYGHGAFRHAYRQFPADFYFLVYDSLMVNAPLHQFESCPLTTVRHWDSNAHGWGWDQDGTDLAVWGGEVLDRLGMRLPAAYTGIMGPMWFAQTETLAALDRVGYWDIPVNTKYEVCAMERVTGIVFEQLGYRPGTSLQGDHTSHDAAYDETYVTKINVGRM
jgi:hypothetical protein